MWNLKYVVQEAFGRLIAFIFLPIYFVANKYQSLNATNPSVSCWLVGENQGECLEDNGYAFYRYCREYHPDKKVFFLLKQTSPFYSGEFSGDENVVPYGSLRHMFLFATADIFFYTHTYRDLMYRRFFELFHCNQRLVYLHHGTLGFKKFDLFYHRNRNLMDLFTVGSRFEQDILVNLADVDPGRVKLTGYARSDRLGRNSVGESRQIIYMPTHRRHLGREGRVKFVRTVKTFLSNSELASLLEKYDLRLKVYLHAHAQKTLSFDWEGHPRIRVVNLGSESVKDLLSASRLMITDYSSVCWDFLSLGKPVIFYRFDIDNYVGRRDSYIDLRDEVYGEIAYDEEKLVQLLSNHLASGCHLKASVVESIGAVLSFDGRSNCDRIFSIAEELDSRAVAS